jgi:hypothetical protein
MIEQVLPPGVQNGEKADLGAQVFRVTGDGEQGFRRGAEQKTIEDRLVLERDAGDLFRRNRSAPLYDWRSERAG